MWIGGRIVFAKDSGGKSHEGEPDKRYSKAALSHSNRSDNPVFRPYYTIHTIMYASSMNIVVLLFVAAIQSPSTLNTP